MDRTAQPSQPVNQRTEEFLFMGKLQHTIAASLTVKRTLPQDSVQEL